MYQANLDLFRSTRAQTVRIADGLTQPQADFTPARGKWSAGEVLDHLLLSEKLYRDAILNLISLKNSGRRPVLKASFQDVNTSIAFIPKSLLPYTEIPFTIFNMFVPSFVRETMTQFRLLPAQVPDIAVPRKGRPVADLRADLRSSLQDTDALFEANSGLDYRELRYQHPLMGDNNVLQILRILSLHERRHQSQIQDIFRSRQFPKAA